MVFPLSAIPPTVSVGRDAVMLFEEADKIAFAVKAAGKSNGKVAFRAVLQFFQCVREPVLDHVLRRGQIGVFFEKLDDVRGTVKRNGGKGLQGYFFKIMGVHVVQ